MHAVSVGEVLSCIELIRRIRATLPHTPVYVSCSTLSGREVADAKLAPQTDGVFYVPVDIPFAVRRILRTIRPSVLVALETEIWPILYREAKRSGASVLIVNARISDKAFPKYAPFEWFFRAAFESVDAILAQSARDQERFLAIGAPGERVRVAGNLKYDFDPKPEAGPAVLMPILREPLWIAASTTGPMHEGDVDEDDVVIAAHGGLLQQWPRLQLLIAPRKPERFDAVAAKLERSGLSYKRRSMLQGGEESPSVILLDSLGELGSAFHHAALVFMGGTLAARGGHNFLEPALCGKPVIAGPSLENFAAIRDRFALANAYVPIAASDELEPAVRRLLGDPSYCESLGARGRLLAESERGATDRALKIIQDHRWQYIPRVLQWFAVRPLLWLLSRLWIAGGRLKRASTKTRSLSTPVISVGGIAMGGVGKTPMVCYLADMLKARGYCPAVLTRGYRRQSTGPLYLAQGTAASPGATGDEAQLLLRHSNVGIGSDRWAVGKQMEQQFHPSVFLLDDGFQHKRLHRDIDIVLLDALDPLAGDAVFPQGRLREPAGELRRAGIIIISRAGERRFDGLLRRLPEVPVFYSDIQVAGWRPDRPPLNAVAAFCGLANPQTFLETLESEGVRTVFTQVFPDHHRYTAAELQRLGETAQSHGATALVTTAKDWVNLPERAAELVAPLPLCCMDVRTILRDEAAFWVLVEGIISSSLHHR